MEEDLRRQVEEIRNEILKLKRQVSSQLGDAAGAEPALTGKAETRGLVLDVGDWIEDILDAVKAGVRGEISRSIFIGLPGVQSGKAAPKRIGGEGEPSPQQIASVMSALGSEHRVMVLMGLSQGGKYAGELEQELKEISPSTLSGHLRKLVDAGLISQDSARRRYLITIPGRFALGMAVRTARLLQQGDRET